MWWFYTIILGMSFGQVLEELAKAVRDWSREPAGRRPFLPAMLWQIFLLALIIQVWLAVTYYRETVRQISILELLAFLAVPVGILVMSFVLPDARPESRSGMSAAATFGRIRPIFFGVLIAMVAVNLLHGFLIGQQDLDFDLVFQCLIIAGAVVGLRLRNTVADSVLAAVMIAIVLTYIGVGYSSVNVSPEVAFESAPPVGGKLL